MVSAVSAWRAQRHALRVGRQHASSGAGQHGVEPDGRALVLRALDLDVMRLALPGQLDRVVDHLGPGDRRGLDQIGPVPQQLGVAEVGHRDELVVPDRRLQRRLQRPGLGLLLVAAGPRHDPLGLGELGRPRDVEHHDVDRAVTRSEPSDELLTLLIGGIGQYLIGDRVLSVTLCAAGGNDLRGSARDIGVSIEIQRDRAGARVRAGAGGQQRREQDAAGYASGDAAKPGACTSPGRPQGDGPQRPDLMVTAKREEPGDNRDVSHHPPEEGVSPIAAG